MRKFIPIWLVIISTVIAVLIGELVVRFVVTPGDFLFATMIEDPILRHRRFADLWQKCASQWQLATSARRTSP